MKTVNSSAWTELERTQNSSLMNATSFPIKVLIRQAIRRSEGQPRSRTADVPTRARKSVVAHLDSSIVSDAAHPPRSKGLFKSVLACPWLGSATDSTQPLARTKEISSLESLLFRSLRQANIMLRTTEKPKRKQSPSQIVMRIADLSGVRSLVVFRNRSSEKERRRMNKSASVASVLPLPRKPWVTAYPKVPATRRKRVRKVDESVNTNASPPRAGAAENLRRILAGPATSDYAKRRRRAAARATMFENRNLYYRFNYATAANPAAATKQNRTFLSELANPKPESPSPLGKKSDTANQPLLLSNTRKKGSNCKLARATQSHYKITRYDQLPSRGRLEPNEHHSPEAARSLDRLNASLSRLRWVRVPTYTSPVKSALHDAI